MKKLLLLLIFVSLNCAHGEKLPITPRHIGEVLSKKIPKDWMCVYSHSEIVIIYKKKIYMLNAVSLPQEPSFELAKKYGWESDYFVVLSFVNKYSQKELELLIKNRKAMGNIVQNKKLDPKTRCWQMSEINIKFPLPTYYNDEYSVFLHRPDSVSLRTYPESFNRQKKKVFSEIEALLKKYKKLDGLQKS